MIKRNKSPKEIALARYFSLLSKFGNKTFERFETDMYKYLNKLSGKVNEKTTKHLEKLSGEIYRKELKHIKADLRVVIDSYYKRLRRFKYRYGVKKEQIPYELDGVDEKMIKTLYDADLLWVMNHSTNTWMMRFVQAEMIKGIDLGMTGSQIAGAMKMKMGEMVAADPKLWNKRFTEDSYWRMVTGNTVRRTSSFANIHSMQLAGITQYRILTRDPCPICIEAASHIYQVEDAAARMDAFIEATEKGDLDAMKDSIPFAHTKDELNIKGLITPLHENCECEEEYV